MSPQKTIEMSSLSIEIFLWSGCGLSWCSCKLEKLENVTIYCDFSPFCVFKCLLMIGCLRWWLFFNVFFYHGGSCWKAWKCPNSLLGWHLLHLKLSTGRVFEIMECLNVSGAVVLCWMFPAVLELLKGRSCYSNLIS